MLRRKAAPTQTELHLEYSQMVNEALELIAVDLHSKGTSDASTSLDPHAHVDAQPCCASDLPLPRANCNNKQRSIRVARASIGQARLCR